MAVRKRLKLRKPFLFIIRILGVLLVSILAFWLFYLYQINSLMNLGYSEIASKKILSESKKDFVISIGENKTLNAAFESKHYKEGNIDSYSKVNFYDYKDFIESINLLIDKGYSNSNINLIFEHGSNEDILKFAKREKIKYLEEFYSIKYAKIKYYDRYVAFSNETGEDEKTTVLFVNLGMDKDDYVDAIEVDKFSYDMLVNKHYVMDKDLVASDLIKIDDKYTNGDDHFASSKAVSAFVKMSDDALKDGYELVINSSYRSYLHQEELCDEFRKLYGNSYVEKYVAKPGYSEHQTGLAFDIGSRNSNVFANSKEYKWMLENAHKYGFILRFSKDKKDITGFKEEPWHYRYVGVDIAKYIYENNISFEEYYAIFLDKD